MDDIITLAHGAGGRLTAQLIRDVFMRRFDNPLLTADDAALLPVKGRVAMTTDGFIVSPAFFPGGDIGRLSVCGTVNDLACMGARPLYLTCSFIIEEGFCIAELERIAASMAAAAQEAGVAIVAGDTKVTARGQCGGIFITTAGIGLVGEAELSGANAREGDVVIVTGDIGRHGCAILLARGDFGIQAAIESDCAPLWGLVEGMLKAAPGLHVLRDATRGGVGTVLNEIAQQSHVSIELDEAALPVQESVGGLCGLLGLDPLYMACEGRMVAVVPEHQAQAALDSARRHPYGAGAAVVGRVTASGHPGRVVVNTAVGGKRLLAEAGGELLPRIC